MTTQPASEEHAADSSRRRPRWSELCWIGVLVAIGVIQVVRGQWFDAAIFAVVVAMLAMDASGLLPDRPRRREVSLRIVVIAAVVAGVTLLFLERHGIAMGIAMAAIGVLAVTVAWPGSRAPASRWPRGIIRLACVWAVIIIAGCLWELVEFIAFRVAPHSPPEALSDLANPVLSTVAGKAAFIAVWLAAGVWLLRRGRV